MRSTAAQSTTTGSKCASRREASRGVFGACIHCHVLPFTQASHSQRLTNQSRCRLGEDFEASASVELYHTEVNDFPVCHEREVSKHTSEVRN